MNKYGFINDKVSSIKLRNFKWENNSDKCSVLKIKNKDFAELAFDKEKNEFSVIICLDDCIMKSLKCNKIKEAKKMFIEHIESFLSSIIKIEGNTK